MGLKILSHNTNGFNSPHKRKKAFQQYKKLGADIILLQETHFASSNHPKYFNKTYNQAYFTTFDNKTRGVAIFIRNTVVFDIQNVYRDPDSRYLILKGSINNRDITIASVYAPNDTHTSFFSKFFETLDKFHSPHILIGGDFNLASHPVLDRSNVSPHTKSFSKTINRLINKSQLIDTWRAHNIGIKAYTHYSHPHDCYARLDYIFSTPILLANSTQAQIYPCPWSDHDIVAFSTSYIGLIPSPYNWRFNDSLLTDTVTRSTISSHIENYFTDNVNEDTLPTSIWVAHKAVLRGHVISIAAAKNKEKQADIKRLTNELHHLYIKLHHSTDPIITQQIQDKRKALDLILSANAERTLRFSKAKFMLHCNSHSAMFARKLKQDCNPTHIYKLRDEKGNVVAHPQKVMEIFNAFYKKLMSDPNIPPGAASESWLESLSLPSLDPDQLDTLNAHCTTEEITQIIKSLKTSTAPGPDGYSSLYYKKFAPLLAPHLKNLFNHILEGNTFPREMLLANLSLIPKPNKDHSLPQNYRPISVLNNDLKIFGRILADRLAKVISPLIHIDQSGFIPNRQITDNIRLVTNVIQDANLHSRQTCLLSLDIHKAFDSVSWSYLNHILPRFGILGRFLQGFNALYSSPQTRIRLPGINSEFFSLGRGTRQGCPLSPLLFALAIEPLAQAIRCNHDISGYLKGNHEYKISLYADDALVYITNPHTSIPVLLKELDLFHKISGLKINLNKCSAMPVNIPLNTLNLLQSNFPFTWITSSIKYLGVNITPNHRELFKANYTPLFARISTLLNTWSPYHISFLGRVCAIKMNILPKLLYYFRTLPINISKSRLEAIQRLINKFIWANKRPRYSYALQHRTQTNGGLGLPNIWKYFLAARLSQLSQWFSPSKNIPWKKFETSSITPLHLQGILWSRYVLYRDLIKRNIIVAHLYQLWLNTKDPFLLSSEISPLTSFLGDPRLISAFQDRPSFSLWIKCNLTTLGSLQSMWKFKTFESLQREYNLPSSEQERFLTIKSFYQKHFSLSTNPTITVFERICLSSSRDRGMISRLYNYLNTHSTPEKSQPMLQWEAELNDTFPLDTWLTMSENLRKSNKAISFRETPMKLFARWYLTPSKIHTFYPSLSPNCFRGCQSEGTLLHLFWSCPRLSQLWIEAASRFEKSSKHRFPLTPQICVLYGNIPDVPLPCSRLFHSLCSSIQWMIALNWRSDVILWSQVLDRMDLLMLSERIHHTLNDSRHIFEAKWAYWSLSD